MPLNQAKNVKSNVLDFDAVRLTVASSENILEWSSGEVLKPETINYRTQKPERDGLFCERIFGPIKDYECYCGKYRKVRFKGVTCDKCGVEVTKSSVRRERMGHIDLAVPVAHIWYVQGVPSILSLILDLSVVDLEKVVYFASYVVLEVKEDIRQMALENVDDEFNSIKNKKSQIDEIELKSLEDSAKVVKKELLSLAPGQIISENKFYDYSLKYGNLVEVGIGAEALLTLLKNIDVDTEIRKTKELLETTSTSAKKRLMKKMKILIDFKYAKILPSSLVLTKLPVIPPDLRPMVQLDGGRFAASDLNDLYRRVLNRNNRLKKLLNQGAPEVITRNEKRMLQEAVDALIDNNARRGKAAAVASGRRKLKSLSDILRGKQGRFRQNLLGKRVDYSGRSVIVVGPELKLHQCGLPKIMAMELFKPFVIGELLKKGYVHNVRNASKLIESGENFIWDILEKITKEHYILLNRAPTLHRLGIQAFQPVLIEGKAIRIHPLVCAAFNADFDGDQMAVHIPLSKQAQYEATTIMKSSNNLLKPASGEPIVGPTKDMIMGCYYLTSLAEGMKGEGKIFADRDEAYMAFLDHVINLRSKIKVRLNNEIVDTSIGRIIFNKILPDNIPFQNNELNKKALSALVALCFKQLGPKETAQIVDKIKNIGFEYAGFSGITFSIKDIISPVEKESIIKESEGILDEIDKQYRRGLITEEERYAKTIELWIESGSKVEAALSNYFDDKNPIVQMFKSGARGSIMAQLNQIGGMKGLVANPTGEIIPIPIKNNFRDGLSVFEYFVSTHGSRKGRTDTALRTSEAGYLTRRLVDVAQDTVVSEHDCGTEEFIMLHQTDSLEFGEKFLNTISGRVLAKDVEGFERNTLISEEIAKILVEKNIKELPVRSALRCRSDWGICRLCYGEDLATGDMVKLGEAVGIVAAQAIGEPGTQLTMRTFHMGGVASSRGDITSGLPRVEELFEARLPKSPAALAEIAGKIEIRELEESKQICISSLQDVVEEIKIDKKATLEVQNSDKVHLKQTLATNSDGSEVVATIAGIISVEKNIIKISGRKKFEKIYEVDPRIDLLVKDGEMVEKGTALTEGHIDTKLLLDLKGRDEIERYILNEVQKIYASQGQTIDNKHIEIIIRQMVSKVTVIDPGSSLEYVGGEIIDRSDAEKINAKIQEEKGDLIQYSDCLLGISRVSLKTKSFLSAASFQETTGVLINAAISGSVDRLRGLKENVIIGKLIPAGTGFRNRD